MSWDRAPWIGLVLGGVLYSVAYASERITETLADHVPMHPAPVGLLVLFIIGATIGFCAAMLSIPAAYFQTPKGKRLLDGFKAHNVFAMRAYCSTGVLFVAAVTLLVLWWAFVYTRP